MPFNLRKSRRLSMSGKCWWGKNKKAFRITERLFKMFYICLGHSHLFLFVITGFQFFTHLAVSIQCTLYIVEAMRGSRYQTQQNQTFRDNRVNDDRAEYTVVLAQVAGKGRSFEQVAFQ